MISYIKALHIIFVVTWFAGLFYIVRLFIYHVESYQRPENEGKVLRDQFKIMEKRLWYGITWPSMILTYIFGFWLLTVYDWWSLPFIHVKLTLVAGLTVYHHWIGYTFKKLNSDLCQYSSTFLRVMNEVATLFLVGIVFVIVLKDSLQWLWAVLGLVIFGATLMLAILLYKKLREKNPY
ncbi:MAG: CopD family protein [Cytophagales bacterium]